MIWGDKTDGEKAGPGNYSSGIIIQSDVLNGLRSAKGNVVYQEYNVLNGSYGNRREYESTNDHYINVLFALLKLLTNEFKSFVIFSFPCTNTGDVVPIPVIAAAG